jgi:thiosulfate reductase cytochrome b subunit
MSAPQRLYLYTVYERVWHWGQALGILALLLTGIEIAAPGRIPLLGFERAVWGHNLLALVLVANAGLGLFYYIATGTLRQLLPEPRDFITLSLVQARYYVLGIFRGEPHPLEKTAEARLNPLQRATYLVTMNVLLPLQVLTGLAMWGCSHCPGGLLARIGGMAALAQIHSICAWLFSAFIIAHVYLTTTGHTPLASIKAMILGWEELHPSEPGAAS